MEKQPLRSTAEKLLLIERDDNNYTPVSSIPDEYLPLLLPYAGAYFYRDEDCDMLCQHIRVKEFSIWGHDIFARNYIILNPRTPRHILALHYMHEDTIDAVIDHMGPFRLKEKEVNLFSLHSNFHSAALDRNNKIFSFHINVSPGSLAALAASYPGLQHLAGFQLDDMNGPVNAAPYVINAVSAQLLYTIFNCRYIELPAECLLHRCCVDLYQNFALQDAQYRACSRPAPSPADDIMAIFRFIGEHIHQRFTARELAARFRLPGNAMNAGFEQSFAISVPDYILQQRMMKVYKLLLHTKASLSNIAWKTGYPNRLSMTADFVKYFSYDPVTIRNAQ
ncbi:helix-turn-helix transcriptional regulator [Chitinophaga japonensis]|uniref:AraC-like DNA-binding protein n=1 Tax=Chitinophaga japonensis TaxID=104662 RepID=A0A562TCN9_CHIJA|nr:AraC family transcriptional regulator [Chitinophaga japonensis]TWI91255.1 AraC-like DNA-binding protein [Chitinophaga japonensis]